MWTLMLSLTRFADHSQTLPGTLERAHERSWLALGVALDGAGFLDRMILDGARTKVAREMHPACRQNVLHRDPARPGHDAGHWATASFPRSSKNGALHV